jgi:hypothetical protein
MKFIIKINKPIAIKNTWIYNKYLIELKVQIQEESIFFCNL